jgi:cytochrome oxidase Cu insertion factor (SCO1/SenC/PrrC family)
LKVTESSGKEVELKDLKGKVLAACWVFTHCPRGCPGVIAEMNKAFKDIRQKAGANADSFHFLSFSVDPDDKPADLREFMGRFGIDNSHWWFLTGPKDTVRPYMNRYFGFYDVKDVPEKERLSPDDKFVHDMRIALVDPMGHVRGFYDLVSTDPEARAMFQEKFREDALRLLNERREGSRPTSVLWAYIVVVLGCCGYLVWQRVRTPRSAVAPA